MAELSNLRPTLVDVAKRLDPDGKIAAIAELLAQTNPILQDMVFKEGNLPTGHRSTARTTLPGVSWRRVNAGTTPTKSKTAQTEDQTAILDAWSEIDKKVADLNGNTAAWRLSEASAFIEAMNQEMVGTLFYGNSNTDEKEFTGFAPRYASPTGSTGQNVLDAGGSGSDNTSIFLVVWGDNCHGIYPKGSTAGLKHTDYGLQVIENAGGVSGALMEGYRDHYEWEMGLHIRDWRYVVRIGSIDVSNLGGASEADLTKFMTKAVHRIPMLAAGRAAFYCNRTVAQYLDIQRQAAVAGGGQLSYQVVDGIWTSMFRGIPIRTVDQIVENEAAV
jgi:hypothetical protein